MFAWGFSMYKYIIPIGSMYGIFTYIYHKNQPNVGKYTIHGSYGISLFIFFWILSEIFQIPTWTDPGKRAHWRSPGQSENDSTDFFPEKFDEEIPQMMGPWQKVSPVSDMASFRVSMLELSPNHLCLCKPFPWVPYFYLGGRWHCGWEWDTLKFPMTCELKILNWKNCSYPPEV